MADAFSEERIYRGIGGFNGPSQVQKAYEKRFKSMEYTAGVDTGVGGNARITELDIRIDELKARLKAGKGLDPLISLTEIVMYEGFRDTHMRKAGLVVA